MSATELAPVRILVTGCAGRVGTAACADLLAAGLAVRGIDVRQPESSSAVDFRLCDLTQEGALAPHLQDIDAVLHLAAIPVPRLGSPADIFQLNCAGTFRLFQACAEADVCHVVVASSINAIGYYFGTVPFEIDYLPVDEGHPKTTSDAYSFSKQITEDIGAYFARREGVNNACLRFGAGLTSLADMGQHQADDLRATRAFVQQLAALPEDAARVELDRMQSLYDEARRGRTFEGGTRSRLAPEEQRLMSLRHNYFSFIELGEACRAMRLALMTPFTGHHTLFIVDQHNYLGLPAGLLAEKLYPGVHLQVDLVDDQSLVDWRRAANLLSFASVIPATMVLET
jgi:nucleoside-diphosphate-sugar epimerase